jgi:hypothetical protein
VFGPSFPAADGRARQAERFLGQLVLNVPMFGDGVLDDAGLTEAVTDQQSVLYRDDREIGRSGEAGRGYFPVPAEPATYRLHSELGQRGAQTSTRTIADWTFASAPETDGRPVDLPLLAVRFTAEIDNANTAPGGGPFTLGVAVQRNGTGPLSEGVDLRVGASTDDGLTWHPAALAAAAGCWTATVQHPTEPGFVSLRAVARDGDGNLMRQTITRAYAVR